VALPRDTPASSSSPSAFGRYRVVHQLGAGVLGPVFRAYDPRDDRAVAVKAFPLDLTPEQARDVAEELGRLPALPLVHPSVVAPLAAGVEGTTAYLVEEYFVAESADVALKLYGPAPVPDAMRLVGQLAGALDFAAAAGVHHGSLHPRDILVAPHEVRLTGLGIVAALERVGYRPPVRRPYAAPERVEGRPASVAADIFSLACVAFELVTGRRPTLAGDSVTADPGAIQAADAAALAEAFARALATRPEDRYPAALVFAAALKHALTGEPLQDGVAVERPRPRRAGRAGMKTPSLPLVAPSAPAPEAPGAAVPGDLPLAVPPGADGSRSAAAELPLQDASREEAPQELAPPDLPIDLPSEPAPGGTPLPSFFETYRAVPAEAAGSAEPEAFPADPRDEPTGPIPGPAAPLPLDDHRTGTDLPPDDGRWEPTTSVPVVEPPDPRPEALALRLEEPGTADRDGQPGPPVPPVAGPPVDPSGGRRVGMAPLVAILLTGMALAFAAGYAVAPRGAPAGPASSSTQGPPAHGAPDPAAPRGVAVPDAAAPIGQGGGITGQAPASIGAGAIEASRPAAVPAGAAPGGAAGASAGPADASPKPTARERRLARLRARREAARAEAGRTPGSTRGTARFEGRLVIASKPAGASVRLDGKPVGATPVTLPAIAAGAHAIRLELAGYAVWSSSVQVAASRENRVTASLERRPGG
jgi:serine/threonine protein kinase